MGKTEEESIQNSVDLSNERRNNNMVVGDIVKAIDNNYNVTSLENDFIGRITEIVSEDSNGQPVIIMVETIYTNANIGNIKNSIFQVEAKHFKEQVDVSIEKALGKGLDRIIFDIGG